MSDLLDQLDTLTVGELKEALEGHDDDLKVCVAVNYGDRCGTMQAIGLSEIETSGLEETSYSSTGLKVTGEESDSEEDAVLVLNYDSYDYD